MPRVALVELIVVFDFRKTSSFEALKFVFFFFFLHDLGELQRLDTFFSWVPSAGLAFGLDATSGVVELSSVAHDGDVGEHFPFFEDFDFLFFKNDAWVVLFLIWEIWEFEFVSGYDSF